MFFTRRNFVPLVNNLNKAVYYPPNGKEQQTLLIIKKIYLFVKLQLFSF